MAITELANRVDIVQAATEDHETRIAVIEAAPVYDAAAVADLTARLGLVEEQLSRVNPS
jgi:hypothetical protein